MEIVLDRDYLLKQFKQLEELSELKLISSGIIKVEKNTFDGLTNLEKILLWNNHIGEIEANLFSQLSNLKDLYLQTNKLNKIDPDAFKGLISLEILMLNSNQIERIDQHWFEDLSSLKKLWLDNNKLEVINSNAFKQLTSLEAVYLHMNQIERIESNAFADLSKLKLLWLFDNKISSIESDSFKGLSSLEALLLNNNNLEKIDPNLFVDFSSLTKLYLFNNNLKMVKSNGFRGLVNLEELYLHENQIEWIEQNGFSGLSNLKVLYLFNNMLKSIESNSFRGLDNLSQLWLNGNRIEDIDVNGFNGLENLDMLNLERNKIKEIDRNCFKDLKRIFVIKLYKNELGENVVSYLNKSQAPETWDNASILAMDRDLRSNGLLTSDWDDFLKQFQARIAHFDISSCEEVQTDHEDTSDRLIGRFVNGDRYKTKKAIGKGAFGKVYLVFDTFDRKIKAMKTVEIVNEFTFDLEHFILSRLDNENIVKYYCDFEEKIQKSRFLCIITEYCKNGDLKTRIKKTINENKKIPEMRILKWMLDATNAMKYLHAQNYIHRDIKPANMLLTNKNVLKLSDLEMSSLIETSQMTSDTQVYMSPEQFRCQNGKYSTKTDIWSLGCVLYELLFLSPPFPKGLNDDPPLPDLNVSYLFSKILSQMLKKNPNERIDSNDLFDALTKIKEDVEDDT